MKEIEFHKDAISHGTDPEFFFRVGGSVLPANNLLPVRMLQKSGDRYHSLHYDGIAVEINTSPSVNREDVVDLVRSGIASAEALVSEYDGSLDLSSTVSITPEVLAIASPDARQFGCEPDFLAWAGGTINVIRTNAAKHMFRYAGGHLHVGFNTDSVREMFSGERILRAVQLHDIIVGIPFLTADQFDGAAERRRVYGKAGTFRITDYGFEYRALSNVVLRSPTHMRVALGLSQQASLLATSDELSNHLLAKFPANSVVQVINNSRTEEAGRMTAEIVDFLRSYGNPEYQDDLGYFTGERVFSREPYHTTWGLA